MEFFNNIISRLPDWIINIIIVILIGFSLFKIKKVWDFFSLALFGKDRTPDYKELTGALGFINLSLMSYKHFTDNNYEPDLYLLLFWGGVVLTMAGFEDLLKMINKIVNTYLNKSKNEVDIKK